MRSRWRGRQFQSAPGLAGVVVFRNGSGLVDLVPRARDSQTEPSGLPVPAGGGSYGKQLRNVADGVAWLSVCMAEGPCVEPTALEDVSMERRCVGLLCPGVDELADAA